MMPTPPSNDFRLSEPPPETRRAFVRKPLESSGQPVAVELDVYVQAEAHRVTRVQRARLLLDGRPVGVEVPLGTEQMALAHLAAELLHREGLVMEYAQA